MNEVVKVPLELLTGSGCSVGAHCWDEMEHGSSSAQLRMVIW